MEDTRIYYINPVFIIMGDPYNGNHPVLIMRHPGTPTEDEWKEVERILKLSRMKLVGNPNFRSDGLWYHPVKEVKYGREELLDSLQ